LATPLAFNPLTEGFRRLYNVIISIAFGYILCRRKFRYIFNHFYAVRPGNYGIRWNNAK